MGRSRTRCAWAGNDPLSQLYHDREWGIPVHNDRLLFEMLTLEGAQAGLSWITILRKRKSYRIAFDRFDYRKVARYGKSHVRTLLRNEGIVRNRAKIESTISNARAFLAVREEFGSFDAYLWGFTGGKRVINRWKNLKDVPSRTDLSDALSGDLKRRGFRFVGSTICYAFLQAVGVVNDHTVTCFRYRATGPRSKGRSR